MNEREKKVWKILQSIHGCCAFWSKSGCRSLKRASKQSLTTLKKHCKSRPWSSVCHGIGSWIRIDIWKSDPRIGDIRPKRPKSRSKSLRTRRNSTEVYPSEPGSCTDPKPCTGNCQPSHANCNLKASAKEAGHNYIRVGMKDTCTYLLCGRVRRRNPGRFWDCSTSTEMMSWRIHSYFQSAKNAHICDDDDKVFFSSLCSWSEFRVTFLLLDFIWFSFVAWFL